MKAHANAICERWIGSACREALDSLLIAGERHLWYVLTEYVEHYNRARPHRSLGLRAQLASEEPGQPMGEVVCRSRLGGLLNDYSRQAARSRARDFLYLAPPGCSPRHRGTGGLS